MLNSVSAVYTDSKTLCLPWIPPVCHGWRVVCGSACTKCS